MADIDKIKGSSYVYYNGEYVVLPCSKLYILKADGSLIACRKDLRYASRITFLSGNRMLLSSKAVFHMIDLRDGTDIWTAPYVRNNLNVNKLVISPDEAFAYTHDNYNSRNFISRLNLTTHEVDTYDMFMDAGATRDMICDQEGVPYLLKTLIETIGGKQVNQCGVRIHDFDGIAPGGTTTWKTKWSFSKERHASCFFDSADRIVTDDLQLFEPETGELSNLLENETFWQPLEQYLSDCWFDTSGRYLCLKYTTVNTIIDLQERRVTAQYVASGRGCLIGDEYWINLDGRFVRKPFPAFEEAPPIKLAGGMDWYFSKRPELW